MSALVPCLTETDALCQGGSELFDNCLDELPYVCPDCYAVGEAPCAAWCEELQRERLDELDEQASAEDDWDDEDADWEVWP